MGNMTNIILTGVGGQGIFMASEIISEAAVQAGYDVKKSEIHGMSQRGGAVQSHLRFEGLRTRLVVQASRDVPLVPVISSTISRSRFRSSSSAARVAKGVGDLARQY